MNEYSREQNDAACAQCAARIRSNTKIRKLYREVFPRKDIEALYYQRRTRIPVDEYVDQYFDDQFDYFSVLVAQFHLLKNWPLDPLIVEENEKYLEALKVFRQHTRDYQVSVGDYFPSLFSFMCTLHNNGRQSQGKEAIFPDNPFGAEVELTDYLDFIEEEIEIGVLAPEKFRVDYASTPTGRLATDGKTRATIVTVAALERHKCRRGGAYMALARECVQELVGKEVDIDDREIRAKISAHERKKEVEE